MIMPFGGWFDQRWTEVYRPAIEAANLTALRADDVFRAGTIMSDVWRLTRNARVIVADLTDRNSNVLYELGLAHAIGKPVVLVSESLDDVPFDLRGLRIVLYDRNDPNWGLRLRDTVLTALLETLADPNAAIPTTFIEERQRTAQPKLTSDQRELLQLKQDVELLKRQLSIGGAAGPTAFFPQVPVLIVTPGSGKTTSMLTQARDLLRRGDPFAFGPRGTDEESTDGEDDNES